jgi:hypothetical protein
VGKNLAMKKLTIEYIKEQFAKEDYKLLTTEYKNNKQKLNYICSKGHKHNISWSNWYKGRRCPYCVNKAKKTIEFIRSEFAKEGYKLLTKEYKNCDQKLNYICSNGHKHNISWGEWKYNRNRCPYCIGNAKLTIEFIRSEFKKEDYILLSDEYINAFQKLEYICPKKHKHSISWSNWKAGYRCPYCAGQGKLTIEFIMAEFTKEGYILLTKEYKNCKQKLDYTCPNGHEHNTTWGNWQAGYRCPICAHMRHSMEFSGFNHPMWKGGISFEPYPSEFNNKLKKSILERDNYECQNPDCWGTSKRLCPHHIDYNKKNCDFFNLITVCNSCNGRANKSREYWTKFYQEIMNKKYGYVYGK